MPLWKKLPDLFDPESGNRIEPYELEEHDYHYVGQWYFYGDRHGNGIVHRLAYRAGVLDENRRRLTLIMHFLVPVIGNVAHDTPEAYEREAGKIRQLIQKFTPAAGNMTNSSIIAVVSRPPEWAWQDLAA